MKVSVTKFQRGACLKLIFLFEEDRSVTGVFSDSININDLAEIRFKFEENSSVISHSVKWKKHESVPEAFNIKINILCESGQLKYSKQLLSHNIWMGWEKMGESTKCTTQTAQSVTAFGLFQSAPNQSDKVRNRNALEISMSVTKVEAITFTKLYEDEDFCDFNLTADNDNASVPVHKACLIVHSDMFKRMLSAEWNETINGCIKIHGVTLQTLKYLKEYLYLGTLPEDTIQLQSLLLIAKCYMIENLKNECIVKLAVEIKPEEFNQLQEFATDNKLPELVQAIVQITPDGIVQGAHQIKKDEEMGAPPAKKNKCDETV